MADCLFEKGRSRSKEPPFGTCPLRLVAAIASIVEQASSWNQLSIKPGKQIVSPDFQHFLGHDSHLERMRHSRLDQQTI